MGGFEAGESFFVRCIYVVVFEGQCADERRE